MGQRSLQGFKEGLEAGHILSLEHLLNSLIWETFEACELLDDARVYIACYSSCCYGGWRTKWMCLITNDEGIVRAVDRPHCPGHWWLRPYQVHETKQGLRFNTKEAAEYTHGIFVRPTQRAFGWPWTGGTPQPVGLVARDHLMAVYSAVKRATKGLQRETVAMAVANVGEGHAQRDAAGKRGTASGLLVEAGIHPWV